jgi:hypothetical protein
MLKKITQLSAKTGIFSFCLIVAVSAFAFSGKMKIDKITPNINSLPEFIMNVLKIAVQIGVPVAAMFIIWSGFLFLTAQGNESQLTKAKNAFVWAVIGMAILLGAWILAKAIEATVWVQIGGN